MNRSDRRAFEKRMRRVHAEGQGVYDIWVIGAENIGGLRQQARDDPEARRLLDLTFRALAKAGDAAISPEPWLCLLCDYEFGVANEAPEAIIIVAGHTAKPSDAICNVLCRQCYLGGAGLPDLRHRIVDYYRRTVLPDARMLAPSSWPPSRA